MRKVLISALVTALVAGLSPLPVFAGDTVQSGQGATFVSVSPVEAKELIETREGLQLVDVRTRQEYSGGALPGSALVTYNSWSPKSFLKDMQGFDRKRPVLLVCAVGGRSWAAASLLSRNGFTEIYNLNGGLQAWQQQRVPLPAGTPAAVR